MIEFFTKQEIKETWDELKLDDRVYRKWFTLLVNYILRPMMFPLGIGIMAVFWIVYNLYVFVTESIEKLTKKG